VRVAVVDSGIYPTHAHIGSVAGGVAIDQFGNTDDYIDRLGHGTAVAGAIREKLPEAELFAVKVFDRRLTAHTDIIFRAFEWCLSNGMDAMVSAAPTAIGAPSRSDTCTPSVRTQPLTSYVSPIFRRTGADWTAASVEPEDSTRRDLRFSRNATESTTAEPRTAAHVELSSTEA